MSEERIAQLVRTVAVDVPVGAAPVDAVVREGRRRERTRRLVVAGVVSVAAGVVAGGTVVMRLDDGAPEPAGVVRVENPLPLPWWGDGTLHLAEVTVPVPGLTDLVAIGDAVAYGTEDGGVVLARADGQRTTVGHKVYEAQMAADPQEGWLSWVDPGVKAPQLVVYDVAEDTELGRVDLPYTGERWERLDAGSYPIAIDQGRVYFAAQDGDWSWVPGADSPRPESPADVDLLDVREGRRIAHQWTPGSGWSENLAVTSSEDDILYTYSGGNGWFSPDAEHLAVRGDDSLRVFPFAATTPVRLDVPHTLSGWEVDLAFADETTVVVTTGGQQLPEPTEPSNGPPWTPGFDTWDVSTCDLKTGDCTTLEDAAISQPPVLSR